MKTFNKNLLLILLITCIFISFTQPCLAKRTNIPVTAKVNSFGTYSFAGKLTSQVKQPQEQEIGRITVLGTYNGEYPWLMRIYTDNTNYTGIAGAVKKQGPAGLVSTDGRFVIPLLVNTPNMGISQYLPIPDINQSKYKEYTPSKLNLPVEHTDRIIMGIDPRNEIWVAGENGTLFDADDNTLGDITIKTPFDIKLKAKFDEKSPASNYTANLYIEIIPCP